MRNATITPARPAAPDLSTPKGALQAYENAMLSGDADQIRAVTVHTSVQEPAVLADAKLGAAKQKLRTSSFPTRDGVRRSLIRPAASSPPGGHALPPHQ